MRVKPGRSDNWPAPAKINLFLHVVGRRADGYHLLQTQFQFLDYADTLSFQIDTQGRITRTGGLTAIAPENDLVIRAATALRAHADANAGANITIKKVLPAGAGLGGGSSNAATTLVALNELWRCRLDSGQLAEIGLQLGADVPVFIHGQAAWAEGVGERLTPHDDVEGPLLVVNPGVEVSTADVFRHPQLTRDTPAIKIHDRSLAECRNDCEPVTRLLYPDVAEVIDWLSRFAPARMSGTGASVFAAFESHAEALKIAQGLPEHWSWFIAHRRNRSPLLDRLDVERRR
jgi:4-diphosphocytidyl-2-C-methyl-D-erythritol kinase